MKSRQIVLSLLLGNLLLLPFIHVASPVTQEYIMNLGAGFHEPGDDWWDNSYKYRVGINFTSTVDRDTNIAKAGINFSNYFDPGDGIIDLASMQLVKIGSNQSSIPVPFQVETDAVDIWNVPNMPDIEGALIQAALEENGTFIGTVFNTYEGEGMMNQSFRFQVDIDDPTDEINFQFVYQPEFERNVEPDDYIEMYAGIPDDWGSPVRIHRYDLPDEKAWTGLITLPLESTLSGKVWINMEAPTLFGSVDFSFFSIDFVFVDGNGFDGRDVTHFIPELEGIGDITQDVYYPRTQVFESTNPPFCKIYTSNAFDDETERYMLYFNLMNESNHEIVDNTAVPFIGELDIPQDFVDYDTGLGTLRVGTNETGMQGEITVGNPPSESWGTFLESGMKENDSDFTFNKITGHESTIVMLENSTTSMRYTAYRDAPFLDVSIETVVPITLLSNVTGINTTSEFTHFATNDTVVKLDAGASGLYSSKYMTLFNNESDVFLMIDTCTVRIWDIQVDGPGPNATISIYVDGNETMKISFVNATESYVDNSTAVIGTSALEHSRFTNRLSSSISATVGDDANVFSPMQLAMVTKLQSLELITVGDVLEFSLFGHNLQSMSVNIDNVTSDVGINGTYTVDLTGRNRGFFERDHDIIVTGRNEFGDEITLIVHAWIASNLVDMAWTIVLRSITTITGFIGMLMASLFSMVIIRSRKKKPGKNCIGENCNIK